MEQTLEFSGFRFVVAPDPDNAGRQLVRIFKDGEPFTDLHDRPITRSFANNVSDASVEDFCRQFATDDALRNQLRVRQTLSCC